MSKHFWWSENSTFIAAIRTLRMSFLLDPATLNCRGQVLKTIGEGRVDNMVQNKVESLIVNTTFSPKDDIPCELLDLEQK